MAWRVTHDRKVAFFFGAVRRTSKRLRLSRSYKKQFFMLLFFGAYGTVLRRARKQLRRSGSKHPPARLQCASGHAETLLCDNVATVTLELGPIPTNKINIQSPAFFL